MVTGSCVFWEPRSQRRERLQSPADTRQHVPTLAPAWESRSPLLTVDRGADSRRLVRWWMHSRRGPVPRHAGGRCMLPRSWAGCDPRRCRPGDRRAALARTCSRGREGWRSPFCCRHGLQDLSGRQDTAGGLRRRSPRCGGRTVGCGAHPDHSWRDGAACPRGPSISGASTRTTPRPSAGCGSVWLRLRAGGHVSRASDSRPAKLRFDMRLQDARTGRRSSRSRRVVPERDLEEIVSKAGGTLRARLGAPKRGQSSATRLPFPRRPTRRGSTWLARTPPTVRRARRTLAAREGHQRRAKSRAGALRPK